MHLTELKKEILILDSKIELLGKKVVEGELIPEMEISEINAQIESLLSVEVFINMGMYTAENLLEFLAPF